MESPFKIEEVLTNNKEFFVEKTNRRLRHLTQSAYREFLLKTDVGQFRLSTWIELVIKALSGDLNTFIKDMQKIGYDRAVQGFQLSNVSKGYQILTETCFHIIHETLGSKIVNNQELVKQIQKLTTICFKGHAEIARSFLKTREEIINEKLNFLENLLKFTRQIISTSDFESIIDIAATELTGLFNAKVVISIDQNGRLIHFRNYQPTKIMDEINRVIELSLDGSKAIYSDQSQNLSSDVDEFPIKRIISIPIGARGFSRGVLTLIGDKDGLTFNEKELNELLQFIYIIAMAIEKNIMLDEIVTNREELSRLSSKELTSGEKLRKILAADIHDTVAQTLAGIGYKIQFCSEMIGRKNELVEIELKQISDEVDNAIVQTRGIMSNLHPSLIETSGLLAALRKLFYNFENRTQIEIHRDFPEMLEMDTDLSICIYRVIEEAIRNVEEHAEADLIEVSLSRDIDKIIFKVSDNGKGFDLSNSRSWVKDFNKFGLLAMKQRVEAFDGELIVKTSLGNGCKITGSVFYIDKN